MSNFELNENIPLPITFNGLEDEISEKLEKLPPTLPKKRLEKKFADLFDKTIPNSERRKELESILEEVNGIAEGRKNFIGKSKEIVHRYIEKLFVVNLFKKADPNEDIVKFVETKDRLLNFIKGAKDHTGISIGEGFTANVIVPKEESEYCFKVILDTKSPQYLRGNDVEEEASILAELADLNKDGARVPVPYYYFMDSESESAMYVMERLDAVTVHDVCVGNAKLPPNFSLPRFQKELEEFVAMMHRKGIYHRDLHMGNIMIDNKTGLPRIIDFGSAKRSFRDEAYSDIDPITQKIIKYQEDDANVQRCVDKLFINLQTTRKGDVWNKSK